MTQERTYSELEVLAIMVSMRDLHRAHPGGHYIVDRDETGRIIGWKMADQQPSRPIPPDHGFTTGRGAGRRHKPPPPPLSQPDPAATGYGKDFGAVYYIMIFLAICVTAAVVVTIMEA